MEPALCVLLRLDTQFFSKAVYVFSHPLKTNLKRFIYSVNLIHTTSLNYHQAEEIKSIHSAREPLIIRLQNNPFWLHTGSHNSLELRVGRLKVTYIIVPTPWVGYRVTLKIVLRSEARSTQGEEWKAGVSAFERAVHCWFISVFCALTIGSHHWLVCWFSNTEQRFEERPEWG
jgi:hypothetical protein